MPVKFWDQTDKESLKEKIFSLSRIYSLIDIKPLTKKQTHSSLGEIEETITSAVIYVKNNY